MTLGPLTIQTPILLLGLLAASIPVLLHLLARVRAPLVYFPTLRFLRMSMDKTARRRRVQHWLLLLLRMLALAVLAMAVAQPLVQAAHGRFGSDRDTAIVIVLDNSLSMRVGPTGSTRFDQARASADRLLAERGFPEAALIVTNGPPGPSARLLDRFAVRDRLAKVQPAFGQADLVAAVAAADELLADSSQPNKEIYLFSDLQACSAGQLRLDTGRADRHGRRPALLAVVPQVASRGQAGGLPGQTAAPATHSPDAQTAMNVAVTAVELDQPTAAVGQKVYFNVTVRNFWHLPQKVKVMAFIDGLIREALAQSIPVLPAGGSQTVTMEWTFTTPGPHAGWFGVQLDDTRGDDLPYDDRRYFALDVADRVKVLLVKARHELDRGQDGGFWVRKIAEATLPGEQFAPIEFAELLAGDSLPADGLTGRNVLITSDLADLELVGGAGARPSSDDAGLDEADESADSQPDGETLAALRRFVRDGGTWLIFLGPDADLSAYNELLTRPGQDGPLLDGRLDRYVGAATGGREVADGAMETINWVDQSHPMFAGLYASATPYRRVAVYRHAVVRLPAGSATRPIARLGSGDPLVVETRLGRGRVVLFATAATPRWTSWLRQPQALAIRQLLLAAVAAGDPLRDYRENETVAIWLGQPASTNGRLTVVGPDGRANPAPLPQASQTPATFADTAQPGIYTWTLADEAGTRRGAFAINVPPAESDLTMIDGRGLQTEARFVAVGGSLAELEEQIEQSRRGWPVWPYLLATVLVVLAIEAKIANRGRPTAEGSLRPVLGG